MTFVGLLIDVCTVLEDTGVTPDDYGNVTPDWTPIVALSDIPCRLSLSTGREVMVGAEVVIADYKIFLQDADITEQNRIRMGSIDYEILLVATRQNGIDSHHKECWLRAVR